MEIPCLNLPYSFCFQNPGSRNRKCQKHNFSPVSQEANVTVIPVWVGVVHGLWDGAPAHPDQGLDHTNEACQQQYVPSYFAWLVLGHPLKSLLFFGLDLWGIWVIMEFWQFMRQLYMKFMIEDCSTKFLSSSGPDLVHVNSRSLPGHLKLILFLYSLGLDQELTL